MVIKHVREGETARITLPLLEDDVALNGTGFTVSDLAITGSDGVAVDTVADFGWVSAAAGTVYYDPDAADFVATRSPYRVTVELTDGGGKKRYYPSGAPAEIVVRPVR